VLIERDQLPDRSTWQASIDRLGFPVLLDRELRIPGDTGFVPCKLADRESGFEVYVDEADPLLNEYATLREAASAMDCAITFRWGGDLAECACGLAAAAALVVDFGGVAYYPDDDLIYTLDGLREDIQGCLAEL